MPIDIPPPTAEKLAAVRAQAEDCDKFGKSITITPPLLLTVLPAFVEWGGSPLGSRAAVIGLKLLLKRRV